MWLRFAYCENKNWKRIAVLVADDTALLILLCFHTPVDGFHEIFFRPETKSGTHKSPLLLEHKVHKKSFRNKCLWKYTVRPCFTRMRFNLLYGMFYTWGNCYCWRKGIYTVAKGQIDCITNIFSESQLKHFLCFIYFSPGLVGTPLPTTPSTVGNSAGQDCKRV